MYITTALLLLVLIVDEVRSSEFATPWQDSSTGSGSSGTGSATSSSSYSRTLEPHKFGAGGRMPSMEQAMEAVSSPYDPTSNLVVALPCQDGIIVVSTLPTLLSPNSLFLHSYIHEHEHENNSNSTTSTATTINMTNLATDILTAAETSVQTVSTPFMPLTTHTSHLAVSAGNAMHSHILRRKIIQAHAKSIRIQHDDGSPIMKSTTKNAHVHGWTVQHLARQIADQCQKATQGQDDDERKTPLLVSSTLLVDCSSTHDDSDAQGCIWQIDPTGQFWRCQLAIVGNGAKEATNHLLECIRTKQKQRQQQQQQLQEEGETKEGDYKTDPKDDTTTTEKKGGDVDDDDDDLAESYVFLREYLRTLSAPDATQLALECILASIQKNMALMLPQLQQSTTLQPQSSRSSNVKAEEAALAGLLLSSSMRHHGRLPFAARLVPFLSSQQTTKQPNNHVSRAGIKR
ncbi:expressed unknown protein [Seminavis robusta]|uniref:GPI-anchored surface protein n=1 Tax=Seminavis robusta TaxID=568900 RepID=A0A9N8D9A7_9STRA|nr:expressed unknown protein [Seminavis robusta]|eukprot:Sro3_g002710.1 n/a (459) ;mRNA; r:221690-223159